MSLTSFFKDFRVSSCIWFPNDEHRNALASIASGFFFFLGWWFIIDVQVTSSEDFKGSYHLCGIFGTISFLMVNSISNSVVSDNSNSSSCAARVWLFLGFVLGFTTMIAASWILFANFILHDASSDSKPLAVWVGVGLFLQNCFIFIASLIYKFGRVENDWWGA